jgi:hypothetical protein
MEHPCGSTATGAGYTGDTPTTYASSGHHIRTKHMCLYD